MKKIICLVLLCMLTFTSVASAHSGRTDSSGGHNCSSKSISKGLCSGYHYHNGGGSNSTPSSSTSTPAVSESTTPKTKPKDKPVPDYTYSSITIYVNDSYVPVVSILYKNRTYIAVKDLPEYWGIGVEWVQDEKLIRLSTDKNMVTLILNSKKVFENNDQSFMDSEPIIINNSLYIPIKAITKYFGWSLNYIADESALYTSIK
jgi:hypothetical protein